MNATRRTRREFLRRVGFGAAALGGVACGFAASARGAKPQASRGDVPAGAAPDRPNILLIMADDIGREVLGCYGGQSYKTPNLDKLAAEGMRFTHCYSQPVCSPSRVKIMTGRYGFRTTEKWGHIPPGERTFGHVLGAAGYATAAAGKWQMCLLKRNPGHLKKTGFDESCVFGWHEGARYHDPFVYWNGKPRRLEGKYGPDVYCDFLIDFMTRNRNTPFLAYFPMALAHAISDDFTPPPAKGPGGKYQSYKELAETMDVIVGRLVKALDDLGLRKKTLILYTTDNGSPGSFITDVRGRKYIKTPIRSMWNGREVRGGKGSMTDAGTRVPLIANWPGTTPAGKVCDDLIDFSDFLPTLAELASAPLPEGVTVDGRTFAPQLGGKKGAPRPWCFTGYRGKAWARTKRWKLYRSGKLYDMDADPGEKRPLKPGQGPDEARTARKTLQAVLVKLKK